MSRIFPYPFDQGSNRRMSAVLETLSKEHNVTLLSFTKYPELAYKYIHEAEKLCSMVKIIKIPKWERFMNALTGLVGTEPLSVSIYKNKAMQREVISATRKVNFDLIYVFDIKMVPYLQLIRTGKVCIDLDISYAKYFERMRHFSHGFMKLLAAVEARRIRPFEEKAISLSERCFISSEADKTYFPPQSHEKIHVLPNVIDIDEFPYRTEHRASQKILLTGRFSYGPNIDSVLFFYNEIYPLVRKRFPNATFWIVGSNPSPVIKQLHGKEGTYVTGYVDSIVPYMREAEVFVCPLRYGGGTRLKILETMAAGIPIVTTTIGCEGLGVRNKVHLLVADTPEGFAERIMEVFGQQTDIETLCNNARKLVENTYDKKALRIDLGF